MVEPTPPTSPTPVPAEGGAPLPNCDMAELLQDVPLHSPRRILKLFSQPKYRNLNLPENIHVHCGSEQCDGVRRHVKHNCEQFKLHEGCLYYFIVYRCSNCARFTKVFALKAIPEGNDECSGVCTKIYQD